jgi:hypothetical protein
MVNMELIWLPALLGLVLSVPALSPEFITSPNICPIISLANQVELTPEQQTQMQAIHAQAQQQASAILTPTQQAQWTERSLWQNTQHLNLTPAQKQHLMALRLRVLGQMHQVLTECAEFPKGGDG